MTNNDISFDRIHGFDALRAIMMLLGLVLHGAMTYSDINYGDLWPLKDAINTNHAFHLLIEFIHVFRMPVFFVVAGFFGALLFYKKSPSVMISNRLHRIVYPFIVGLLILWPMAAFTFTFANQIIAGNENSLSATVNILFPYGLIPQNTIHLWFLYYLALISFITCFIAILIKRLNVDGSKFKALFEAIHKNIFVALIPLTALTFFTLYQMQSSFAITSAQFIPDLNTTMFYFVFYGYGWILYNSKQLISIFIAPAWGMLALGIILFIVKVYFDMGEESLSLYYAMLANSLSAWLCIFAFMGLFLRYASNGSKKLRYVSDSAYWVYLIHLPLIALFAGLIAVFDIPALIKFLIVVLSTSAICYVTYHYFVRNTFIGLFLNGKKYPR